MAEQNPATSQCQSRYVLKREIHSVIQHFSCMHLTELKKKTVQISKADNVLSGLSF